jgi:hypothetical protein
MLLYPPQSAREVLQFYQEFVQDIPDELMVYAAALTTPDGMQVLALVPAYSGDDLDEGDRVLAPLRSFGPPMADLVTRMPYVAMQQMLDAAAPFGLRSYWKSNYLRALPDDAVDSFVTSALQCPSPRSFALIEHAHGAANRVAADATAFGTRERPFDLVVLSLWDSPAEDVRNVGWTREFYEAMKPWSAGLVYVNGLSEDDGSRIREAYSDTYDRLCQVKTKYDPENRFRQNHNIKPRVQAVAS